MFEAVYNNYRLWIVAFFIIPEMKKLSAAARAEQERKTAQPAQS